MPSPILLLLLLTAGAPPRSFPVSVSVDLLGGAAVPDVGVAVPGLRSPQGTPFGPRRILGPLRVSVSDTGSGASWRSSWSWTPWRVETPVEKWDGTLLITTTDASIYHYRFNLHEMHLQVQGSTRWLPHTRIMQNSGRPSLVSSISSIIYWGHGTEVCLCLANDADIDDFILWLVGFYCKIHVTRAANLATRLSIEQTISAGSRNVCLPNESDDTHLSIATSSIERLVSGLEDYALSHGNTCDKCDLCCKNRDCLKVGTGSAKNSDRRRDKGLLVEIAIMVLHFQDFVPAHFTVILQCAHGMDWQSFGFKLKGGFMDDEGNAVLEWDNLTFARVDIAIHTYHGIYPALTDKYVVRKALKLALHHLKADHAGESWNTSDLAQSIAGLISSSSDREFRHECFALLGLGSGQDTSEGAVRSGIGDNMARIIEMGDSKEKAQDSTPPYLFECEKLDEDSPLLDEEDDGDEDMIFDF
ncbi:hypothetical protein ZWY2020_028938 [Hordeum vulgare]|nr:hypothetical protein ZWY2020_028938 [Hordeum vulgare]